MHTTEWALADLAGEVQADDDTSEQLYELAGRLESLVKVLRMRAGNHVMHKVLDQ